ncbi:glucose 1-dehydrogenase [Pseudonocardia ailaonensis]|uniref:Glucose 1-dehydrogenase n=1 Tax=Pseudonocardia ailaonensis TaxID=367279 RepID=A0ABN2N3R9_9PSEU
MRAPTARGSGRRTAIVTGAGSGIGRAIAHRLARDGLAVLVADRSRRRAVRVKDELRADGAEAEAQGCDVTDEGAVDDLVARVQDWSGRVDVLVNNAGIAEPQASFEDQDPALWDSVIGVSLHGTRRCSLTVGERFMLPAAGGRIINIASVAGMVGLPTMHAYSAAKAAVIMFTRTLACDWARHGVTVNAIAPGYVNTPPVAALAPRGELDIEQLQRRIPVGRLGEPEEVAHATAFLAHPTSAYVTGVVLPVDGGWTAFGGAGAAR